MKIKLAVTIELQVTAEANLIGSNEKVVWVSFIGQVSCPCCPHAGEVIWMSFFGDVSTPQPLTVKEVSYYLNAKQILEPELHCEYSEPLDEDEPVEELVKHKIEWMETRLIPFFKQMGFKTHFPAAYGFRH